MVSTMRKFEIVSLEFCGIILTKSRIYVRSNDPHPYVRTGTRAPSWDSSFLAPNENNDNDDGPSFGFHRRPKVESSHMRTYTVDMM